MIRSDQAPDEPSGADGVDAVAGLVGFVHALRADGVAVAVGATLVFAQAAAAVGSTDRRALYWAGRATLVKRPQDVTAYDRIFRAYWEGRAVPRAEAFVEQLTLIIDDEDLLEEPAGLEPDEADGARPEIRVRFSPHEVLRHKDFAICTPAELAEAQRIMGRLALAGATRRSRRHRPSGARRGRPDVRTTVRHAVRTEGEARRLHHLEPQVRARRLVLLCDVSGSMEPYSRALLRFAQVAVAGRARVEAFALGTRLTRLTRELSSRDPDAALVAAAAAVSDWSGGTRLGDGLRRFNDDWGIRGMARGAVVVILSDGWDRGDPDELATQMARLARVAHRVVWVNPLKASPGYQPLARGMAAALPHVDLFVEGHSLASLESLAQVIADAGSTAAERRSGR
jgi:uncharacterized protein